ncbi:MAG TPA: aspartate kinase [Blastocatellia bacterium]|nr:aspartate kinase [Blastocatellia bacterium]
MIIMKFGGTSVEDAASIERVAEIIRDRLALRPIVVVSAMGKTTRRLLDASESSAAGDSRTTLSLIADLKTRHLSEARRLIHGETARPAFSLIEGQFEELKKLLEGLSVLGEIPPRGLDKILSYGELLSSAIVSDALAERGVPARLIDSRDIIKTDDRFGAASVLFDMTDRRIAETLLPVVGRGEVPVLQGFIGSTREGATTTLGFEGSDYTAAIVGAALGVDDIQIWKDVSGLMTADPAVFAGARTVKACSFAEAAELTYFGAKVLHPKAIRPAAMKNIPVHIYNSKRPSATGTAINHSAPECSNLIKSIAYKRSVSVIHAAVHAAADTRADGNSSDDFLKGLINAFGRRRITPLLTAASASRAAFAVDALADGAERDLLEDLSKLASEGIESNVESNKALISLVGEGLSGDPASVSRAFKALDQTRLGVILHGSSPISMNFVIEERDVEEVIARLHEIFFAQLDPRVFE